MKAARVALVAVGAAAMLNGLWTLISEANSRQLLAAAVWLAGGVAAHDFVLAPLVIGAAWLARRWTPRHLHRPLALGGLVAGALTVIAIPVLSGLGRRPDNPTLLDRNYLAGWLAVVAVVIVLVAADALRPSRRREPLPGATIPEGDDPEASRG